MPMTNSDARKRADTDTFTPALRVHDLTPAAHTYLAALVAGWFAAHAELDRPRFLTFVDEAVAVTR